MENDHLVPHVFTRHNLHLHALLLENQAWFSARDLGRFLRLHLDERALRKLDPDQRQYHHLLHHGAVERILLISESGIYALLIYHYCPEYRSLREWLTHDVVPVLRDTQVTNRCERPVLSLLDWRQTSHPLLHWNNQSWIRLQDIPHVLPGADDIRPKKARPWWRWTSRPSLSS
ncbi:BRO-N domain-containing protein [Pseudomonas yamanorum]